VLRSSLVIVLLASALVAVEDSAASATTATSALSREPGLLPPEEPPPRASPLPPKAEFGAGVSTVNCVDEPQNMVDETYTNYLYLTTNGSLPTTASHRYGVAVPHGCSDKDPLMFRVAPRPKSASPANGVIVKWDLFTVEVQMKSTSRVRTLRALFVITSGAKVLGAIRVRFFKVTHFGRYTYVHAAIDRGPCPIRCSRVPGL
jgi:hypothetical protein